VGTQKCLFLRGDKECYSEFTTRGTVWEIDPETKRRYCDTGMFEDCPRYKAKMEYLEKRQHVWSES